MDAHGARAAVGVEPDRVGVGRPLRVERDGLVTRFPRRQVQRLGTVAIERALAVRRRVPARERISGAREGVDRERGGSAVGHLLGGHGTSAAVGVELDRVGIGGESRNERRGDVAVARPGGGFFNFGLNELGVGRSLYGGIGAVHRPARGMVAALRGGGDGAGRVLRAHAARQLVHGAVDRALSGVGRVVGQDRIGVCLPHGSQRDAARGRQVGDAGTVGQEARRIGPRHLPAQEPVACAREPVGRERARRAIGHLLAGHPAGGVVGAVGEGHRVGVGVEDRRIGSGCRDPRRGERGFIGGHVPILVDPFDEAVAFRRLRGGTDRVLPAFHGF